MDTKPDTKQPMSAGQLVLAIAGGILLAVLVIWGAYSLYHANDGMDCSIDNANRAAQGQPQKDCG